MQVMIDHEWLAEIEADPYYVGWIQAWPWQYNKLRRLGVYGKMKYNWKRLCFEQCKIHERNVGDLVWGHKQFWPGAFTAYSQISGFQLPPERQKLWNLGRLLDHE